MNTIKGIGIRNFKSFDDEGVYIDLDKRINLFIGKNNTGKSNVLSLVKSLKNIAEKGFSADPLSRLANTGWVERICDSQKNILYRVI